MEASTNNSYISGYLVASNGAQLSGGSVQLFGSGSQTATSTVGSSGYFYFGGLAATNYALIPFLAGYSFAPASNTVAATASGLHFTALPVVVNPMYGINFSPYMAGQSPNLGSMIQDSQIVARLSIIAPYTQWVRTYSMDDGLQDIPGIAHQLGLRTAAGAWLSTDQTANAAGIAALIQAGKAGQVDVAVVGSEVLLRGDLTKEQLVSYIGEVRQALPGVPIATADTYEEWFANPSLVDAVDVLFVNYYPYWEGVAVTNAIPDLDGRHSQMLAMAKGKPVVVSETGWPSQGDVVGNAVPSPSNSAYYALDFVSWAKAKKVKSFYFSAFDEAWKTASEGPQGAYWGIWDQYGNLKSGMDSVFSGDLLPDNWSGLQTPGGNGTPSLTITSVPAYGTSGNLEGQVLHLPWVDYGVVVYLFVNGGWWVKPTYTAPVTALAVDGRWSCAVVTGGIDADATQYAAFVVPINYSPPLLSGASSLPSELYSISVTHYVVVRHP